MKKLKYSPSSSDGNRSVSYRSRINPVLFPYRPSFFLLSLFYHSRFQKRKQYGKNTETIRKPCGIDTETIGGTREEEGRKEGQDKLFRVVPLTRFQMEA